ncbi:inositol monophosphatase family protein [Haloferax sp. YSSS75]|uniref:inositol monophosphatase family protein n=1 Tax=Haloferax sp. YSSS75 TaxID=3388564 RepID=UPI00398CC198
MSLSLDDRIDLTYQAAQKGAARAQEFFRQDFRVQTKANKSDLLTVADLTVQNEIIELLEQRAPGEPVIGEEGSQPKSLDSGETGWIVDPIDGTNNFVREIPFWGTAVVSIVEGEPLAAMTAMPSLGDQYNADREGVYRNNSPIQVSDRDDPETFAVAPIIWWELDNRVELSRLTDQLVSTFGDLRRYWCAQGTLALVAAGSLEAAVTTVETNPWDTVGGVYMIRQAGGTVTNADGHRWEPDDTTLVASNGTQHDVVVESVRNALDSV